MGWVIWQGSPQVKRIVAGDPSVEQALKDQIFTPALRSVASWIS